MNLVVLPGDGIGKEVTREAMKVLNHIGSKYGIDIRSDEYLAGGASLDEYDVPVKDEVIDACQQADAVILGAVGGPKWDQNSKDKRPEVALLRLRKELGLFTNLRPVKVYDALIEASTLKLEVIRGVDLLVVRELTGGIYFGQPRLTESIDGEERAVDTMEYRTSEIERITRVAIDAARKRRKKVTSVDKANILATSQLWRKTVSGIAAKNADVEVENMLVDNCAMQLVRNPRQFDVLVTENMFGDILSDLGGAIMGSLGLGGSGNINPDKEFPSMFEPIHGSAPDIAGKNIANPLGTVWSAALMLDHLGEAEAAQKIMAAMDKACTDGILPLDLGGNFGTTEITEAIIERL